MGVDGAGGYNLRYVGLELEEGAGEKYPNDAEENEGAQSQKDAGVGGLVRFVLLFCAQGPGEQGVHAHGGARADGDHQAAGHQKDAKRQAVLNPCPHDSPPL